MTDTLLVVLHSFTHSFPEHHGVPGLRTPGKQWEEKAGNKQGKTEFVDAKKKVNRILRLDNNWMRGLFLLDDPGRSLRR